MKKFKKEIGITLVALIITIVVLLILAVVSIGAVQDSGIIAHAENAAGSFNQSKANEIEELAEYEETINKYDPNESKVEYYIMGTLENPGTASIQMMDFNNYIFVTYNYIDGTYTKGSPDITFANGDEIEGDLEINVIGVEDPVNVKGGFKVLATGYPEGYIKNKKFYCVGGAGPTYVSFDLIEDENAIAAIEAGIANIQ